MLFYPFLGICPLVFVPSINLTDNCGIHPLYEKNSMTTTLSYKTLHPPISISWRSVITAIFLLSFFFFACLALFSIVGWLYIFNICETISIVSVILFVYYRSINVTMVCWQVDFGWRYVRTCMHSPDQGYVCCMALPSAYIGKFIWAWYIPSRFRWCI